MPLRAYSYAVLVLYCCLQIAATVANAQNSPGPNLPDVPEPQFRSHAVPPPVTPSGPPRVLFSCPGSFPSDLTLLNCSYTSRQRLDQFLTNGVTDQAMVESIFGSIFTQYATHSPGEWPKDWTHYGYRVGTSYLGSVGRAGTEYIVGSIMHDDPRHIKCSDDPRQYNGASANPDKPFACSGGQRVWHALVDSVTVRYSPSRSKTQTAADMTRIDRTRLPALDRLAGVFAAGYVVYPFEPGQSNTFGAISQRAALSFGGTFLGSFYTEFGSSILSKRKKPK